MKTSTKTKKLAIIAVMVLAAFATGMIGSAQGQQKAFPSKQIKWIVPFSAGGGTDRWARIFSGSAIDVFGQPIYVRNVPGASGVAGWVHMLDQPTDGHTVIQGSPTPVLSLILEKKPPINTGPLCLLSRWFNINSGTGIIGHQVNLALCSDARIGETDIGFLTMAAMNLVSNGAGISIKVEYLITRERVAGQK